MAEEEVPVWEEAGAEEAEPATIGTRRPRRAGWSSSGSPWSSSFGRARLRPCASARGRRTRPESSTQRARSSRPATRARPFGHQREAREYALTRGASRRHARRTERASWRDVAWQSGGAARPRGQYHTPAGRQAATPRRFGSSDLHPSSADSFVYCVGIKRDARRTRAPRQFDYVEDASNLRPARTRISLADVERAVENATERDEAATCHS